MGEGGEGGGEEEMRWRENGKSWVKVEDRETDGRQKGQRGRIE